MKQNNRELTRECNEKLAQIESLQNSSNQTLSDEQTKVRDMQVSVRFINFLHPSHIDFLAARWYEQPHKPVILLSCCSLRFSLIYLSFNFSLVITLVRHSSGTLESGIDIGPTVINLALFSRPYGLIKGPTFINFWKFF